jgi:hypothetical protein
MWTLGPLRITHWDRSTMTTGGSEQKVQLGPFHFCHDDMKTVRHFIASTKRLGKIWVRYWPDEHRADITITAQWGQP